MRTSLRDELPKMMVWEVGPLIQAVGDLLGARFGAVAVGGELSGFSRAPSGHCYFTLKGQDGRAGLRCAMFRRAAGLLDFIPADGQRVEVRGRLAVYEARGELQMVVESMQRAGAGALMAQFLRLKARLEAEGLFEAARKRAVPAFPARVGVVTSLAAAALRDVLTTLARRSPQVAVMVYPALVQGAEAPASLVEAIETAARRGEVDTLLVCRGGGSLEDLWAFNDERVVRALAACPLPVICGVGHETDVTLADFVADLRAATPTAAAELAAPAREDCLLALDHAEALLRRRFEYRLDREGQRIDQLALRLARPGTLVARHRQRLALLAQQRGSALARALKTQAVRLDRFAQALPASVQRPLLVAQQRLALVEQRLRALDPERVLARGYAWVADAQGHPLVSVRQVTTGQVLRTRLADGHIEAVVAHITPTVDAPAEPPSGQTAPGLAAAPVAPRIRSRRAAPGGAAGPAPLQGGLDLLPPGTDTA
jgi:exodeoxyribonuclease VII large subunit